MFEGVLPGDPGGALGLEAAVEPLHLRLAEQGLLREAGEALRPITRGEFHVHNLSICRIYFPSIGTLHQLLEISPEDNIEEQRKKLGKTTERKRSESEIELERKKKETRCAIK